MPKEVLGGGTPLIMIKFLALPPGRSLSTHWRRDWVGTRVDPDGYGGDKISCLHLVSKSGPL